MEQATSTLKSRTGSPVLWAAAAATLGFTLAFGKGIFHWSSLWGLEIAFLLAWWGYFLNWRPRWTCLVCLAAALSQVLWIGLNELAAPAGWSVIAVAVLGSAAIAAVAWPRTFVPALLAAHFFLGAWLLRKAQLPLIDVYEMTRDSCMALSRGQNPYAIEFPDVYIGHPDWEKRFYSPGVVTDGAAHFGYAYMPLSLLLAFGGHLLAGDFRFGSLLAITAAGALIAYARPRRNDRLAAAAAALLLLTPAGYYVIEYGWSEPASIAAMAGVVFCAGRFRAGLPWVVGLLLVSKQHMPLAAPAVLLLRRDTGWFWVKAAAIALAVTLPLVLWDFHAFWHSAVTVQLGNPFRTDSLNLAAAWVSAGHLAPPEWVAFAVGVLAAAFCAWRGPRSAGGFAAAVAVIYLSFFALSKQAFVNYYYFTYAALCCAVGAFHDT